MNAQILDTIVYGIAISAMCLTVAVIFHSGLEKSLAIYLLKRYRIGKACEEYRKLYASRLTEDHLFNPDRHPMAIPEKGKESDTNDFCSAPNTEGALSQ